MRFLILAFVLAASSVSAADPPSGADIPEKGQLEIIRRGDHLETLGVVQAGPELATSQALAPPDDDSDRWFITVVTTTDPKYAAACDKLLADVNAKQFKAWILPDEPAKSWSHYQARGMQDQTQSDWMNVVKPLLEKQEFPAIVIQPPKNGQFGKNATVAGIIHGYDGNAAKRNVEIRDVIKRYADVIGRKSAGHAQSGVIGSPAPFTVSPTDPMLPRNPVIWPAEVFDKQPLTYAEVRKLAPQAPASFVRELVNRKVTSTAEVAEAYEELMDEAKPDSVNPSWLPSSLWDVLAVIGLAAIPLLGMYYHQRHQEQLRLSRESAPPIDEPKSRTARPTAGK